MFKIVCEQFRLYNLQLFGNWNILSVNQLNSVDDHSE